MPSLEIRAHRGARNGDACEYCSAPLDGPEWWTVEGWDDYDPPAACCEECALELLDGCIGAPDPLAPYPQTMDY